MTHTEVAAASDHHFGLLDKERIIAPADYNRWVAASSPARGANFKGF